MRLNIEGKPYGDIIDCVGGAALGDLRTLLKHSGGRVNVRSIKESIIWSFEQPQKDGFDILDLLSDDTFIENMIGAVWLSKREAGEEVTLAEVERMPFQSFYFEWDDVPEDDDAPKVPDADPGEGLTNS